jgi:hypothetical protein
MSIEGFDLPPGFVDRVLSKGPLLLAEELLIGLRAEIVQRRAGWHF